MTKDTQGNERLLHKISHLIVSDTSPKEVADNISKFLCEHLGVDRCILHDYENGEVNFVSEHHSKTSKPITKDDKSLSSLARYIRFHNGINDVQKGDFTFTCEDSSADSKIKEIADICDQFSIISQVAISTTFNGKVNGGLYIHQSSPRNWLEENIRFLEMVAEQFSVVIDRSYNLNKVMVSNQDLQKKTLELKKALKEEKRMRKMQSEFVAMVSHEFKTPLQIIDGAREVLTRKLKSFIDEDGSIEKYLKRIKSGSERMNGLIQSTLNLSKVEMDGQSIKVNKESFNIEDFINEIMERRSDSIADKNITVKIDIDKLPIFYKGDRRLLDHCFTNIVTNAIKYSKKGSEIKIIGDIDKSNLCLSIIDQGIGIPSKDLSKIGNKFFRATNTLAVAGTGIGLYLTKYFVELHNGSVLIDSELGVGTKVTINLPK